MEVRLHDPAAVVPLQSSQLKAAFAWHVDHEAKSSCGSVLGQGCLGGVSGLCSFHEPLSVVGLSEDGPHLEVVAPQFKLSGRSLTRTREGGTFNVLCGGALQGQLSEPGFNDSRDVLVEQVGADAPALGAADAQAGVGDVPLWVHSALQRRAALRASRDPGKQSVMVPAVVVSDATDSVGLCPQLGGDDRLPRTLKLVPSRSFEVAERGEGLHDSRHGAVTPFGASTGRGDSFAGEVGGDLSPADAGRSLTEDPADHFSRYRVNLDLPLLAAAVAERGLDDVAACRVRSGHGGAEGFVRLVTLPLGHDEQQAEHRPSDRCGGVDALSDGDDPSAFGVEVVDRLKPSGDGAGETVELGDDDPAAHALLDALEGEVHSRPIHRSAGAVEVFVDLPDLDAVGSRPAFDCVTLGVRGLEAFPCAPADLTDPDVAVEGDGRGIVYRDGCSGRTDTGGHMERPALTAIDGAVGQELNGVALTAFDVETMDKIEARREKAKTRWHVVYRFYDADDRLLYVGISVGFTMRMYQHANGRPWFRDVVTARLEHVQGRDAALERELELFTEQAEAVVSALVGESS